SMCLSRSPASMSILFSYDNTARTSSYPLSLHDALPIFPCESYILGYQLALLQQVDLSFLNRIERKGHELLELVNQKRDKNKIILDRKSTRLNSSHVSISYAVFCLKKKKSRED